MNAGEVALLSEPRGNVSELIFLLVHDVLLEHAPNEATSFFVVGRRMVDAQIAGPANEKERFQISPGMEAGLAAAHIVAGVLALVEIYIAARRLREEHHAAAGLQKRVENLLVDMGVPRTIASLAASRRVPDLVRVLERVCEETSDNSEPR